jgi:hypothetical protein
VRSDPPIGSTYCSGTCRRSRAERRLHARSFEGAPTGRSAGLHSRTGRPRWSLLIAHFAGGGQIFLILSIIAVVGSFVLRPRDPWIDQQVVEECLGANLCPACAYPLASAPVEPDGCRVCPECGAAWRA